MKRITLFVMMLAASVLYAQKTVKPTVPKILSLYQEGKLAEAKEMADAATTFEKTMNDGKTWYYRGLIYSTIDTTSNEAHKALSDNAIAIAIESFKKADQIDPAGTKYFIQNKSNMALAAKAQQIEDLANYYLNKGINLIQLDEPSYEGSIVAVEKSILIFESALPKYNSDTLAYYVIGLANYNLEKHDEAIAALDKFLAKGGKSKDAFVILYQIYNGPKENKEKALEIVRKAKETLPDNSDFPRIEIGLLIDMDRVAEAKEGLEAAVAKDPEDKILHFYLGYANAQLKNYPEAKKQYLESLRIDPAYFEAQYYYASLFLLDIEALSKEINNLGITAKDAAKKKELYIARVTKSEEAIPHFEKAERMKAPDREMQIDVLEKLKQLYYYVADDAKTKAVTAKLKMLGVSDE